MPVYFHVPDGFGHIRLDDGKHTLYCIGCVWEAAEYGWAIADDDATFLVRAAAAHVPYCPARAPEMVGEELRHIGGGFARRSDGRS